jgi:hypothetical protein
VIKTKLKQMPKGGIEKKKQINQENDLKQIK